VTGGQLVCWASCVVSVVGRVVDGVAVVTGWAVVRPA
jgi:hypothetical protein